MKGNWLLQPGRPLKMSSSHAWLAVAIICGSMWPSVLGGGKISYKLIEFTYNNRYKENICCSVVVSGYCKRCNYELRHCFSLSSLSPDACAPEYRLRVGTWNPAVYFANLVTLKNGTTLPNPFEIPFTRWTGRIRLRVFVFNDDQSPPVDMDLLQSNISINATKYGTTVKKGISVYGRPVTPARDTTILKINISVACDVNFETPTCTQCTKGWYTANCNTYCLERDDNLGHYTCSSVGDKLCLHGWEDPTKDCTVAYCRPRDDNLGHYSCSSFGIKLCLPGWKDRNKNCSEDTNECTESVLSCTAKNKCAIGTHNCHVRATCTNTVGSHTCACNTGYYGNGSTCSDINECTNAIHNCHTTAVCTNTDGSFICTCNIGYSGNGVNCKDINECTIGNCHDNATCTNTDGSFTCKCSGGYYGNGVTCTDINECSIGTHYCHEKATCNNTDGSFFCTCSSGYHGNGVTCTAPAPIPTPSTSTDYDNIPAMVTLVVVLMIVIFILLEMSFSVFNIL